MASPLLNWLFHLFAPTVLGLTGSGLTRVGSRGTTPAKSLLPQTLCLAEAHAASRQVAVLAAHPAGSL